MGLPWFPVNPWCGFLWLKKYDWRNLVDVLPLHKCIETETSPTRRSPGSPCPRVGVWKLKTSTWGWLVCPHVVGDYCDLKMWACGSPGVSQSLGNKIVGWSPPRATPGESGRRWRKDSPATISSDRRAAESGWHTIPWTLWKGSAKELSTPSYHGTWTSMQKCKAKAPWKEIAKPKPTHNRRWICQKPMQQTVMRPVWPDTSHSTTEYTGLCSNLQALFQMNSCPFRWFHPQTRTYEIQSFPGSRLRAQLYIVCCVLPCYIVWGALKQIFTLLCLTLWPLGHILIMIKWDLQGTMGRHTWNH